MFLKDFFEKVNLEKNSADDNKKITQYSKSYHIIQFHNL